MWQDDRVGKSAMSAVKGFALLVVVVAALLATSNSYYMFYGSRQIPILIGAFGAFGVFAAYRHIDASRMGRIVAAIPAVLWTLLGVRFLSVDPNSFGTIPDSIPADQQLQMLNTMMQHSKAEGLLFFAIGLAVIIGAVAGVKASSGATTA